MCIRDRDGIKNLGYQMAFKGGLSFNLSLIHISNVPAKLIKDKAKDGIPGLKAAYAEESFYVGADQLDALVAVSYTHLDVYKRQSSFFA